jgi:hypothetical protein
MRFELLAPHIIASQWLAIGTIVDSREIPNFAPTPAMRPLDFAAYTALREICNRARAASRFREIPGFGNLSAHPGGDLERPSTIPPEVPTP